LKLVRTVLAGFVISLPGITWAQSAPGDFLSNYLSVGVGTGKVDIDCAGATTCSRVDSSGTVRFGHRFDPSWAVELTFAHIDADWGVLFASRSAALTGYGIGAAYTLPLSDSLSLRLRAGVLSNQLKYQPGFGSASGEISTRAVKPHLGVAGSWQFARRWSLNAGADWTRGDLRATPASAKQAVSIRMLEAGVSFYF